ncbi:MAG: hypothetical protein WDN44_15145 [Sphingomonas sp.]
MVFEGHVLLRWWLGSHYAEYATPILAILATATILRNAMLPYVTIAIGLGQQRKMIATPLAEGAISIVTSIALAHPLGAVGVALAKIVGGSCGVSLMLWQHPLRQALDGMSRWAYFRACVLTPATAILPIAIVGCAANLLLGPNLEIVGLVAVGATTLLSVWFLALHAADREFARILIERRLRPQRIGAAS